jgi:hypothetical protein
VKGVGAGRAEVRWWLRAPSGVPTQGRRVRVVGGCCGHGEPRREAADGGAHWRGGRRLAAWEDGRETSGRWGGIDGARRWPVVARRWSAKARHASAAEEWGR